MSTSAIDLMSTEERRIFVRVIASAALSDVLREIDVESERPVRVESATGRVVEEKRSTTEVWETLPGAAPTVPRLPLQEGPLDRKSKDRPTAQL